MPISIPRLSVALLFAFTAFALWACGSTDFKGSAPGNPKDPKNLDIPKTVSPGEEGPLQKEAPPIDPKRALNLQITGLQPEAWWNNCLNIEMGDQSFAIACTKDENVTGRIVTIPIPEGVSCPSLKISVETYVNVGDTCADRFRRGLPCLGPYDSTPTFRREHHKASDRPHFILTEEDSQSAGQLVRVYFEDQPTRKLESVQAQPERASELGIDFNDAVFEIKTIELPFEIEGAAGTKCP
jgi:hypothetical protein